MNHEVVAEGESEDRRSRYGILAEELIGGSTDCDKERLDQFLQLSPFLQRLKLPHRNQRLSG